MQTTSQAYKTEQKQPLREKSYVWVYLGVVDRTAQKTARLMGGYTTWSDVPTGNEKVEGVYATYEQNFFRADGSMYFPPEGAWAMYQGVATSAIAGYIKFVFDKPCDIRGITLKFYDDAIPLAFTISNGTTAGTHTYTYSASDVDVNGNWSCNDDFLRSTYITITPSSLKGGSQRTRIQRILFGKGFYFSDKDLLSTSYSSTVAHLSDNLPTTTFSFTIDNTDKKFSADDPNSYVHFLQEQQEVDFDYGRELPDGSIYTIKGGKTYLKTWSNDDQKATFNTVGYLEFMDTTYKGGTYDPETQKSLYDLAVDVFRDAQITNYQIDSFLQSVKTYNPLPIEKHKNLLQLIANAGMCIFYEDRDGTLTIKSSFQPEISSVTSNGATSGSNLDALFVSETADAANYVSSAVSDANGEFSTNPKITIVWETAWTWYNMNLRFIETPLAFTIKLYKNNTLVESFDVEDIEEATYIEHDFFDTDKMEIIFTKTNANQRIYLSKILFGNVTDYMLEYRDLLSTPNVGTTEFVKNVVTHYYAYDTDGEDKQIGYIDVDDYSYYDKHRELTFTNPVTNTRAFYDNSEYSATGQVTIDGGLEDGDTLTFRIIEGEYTYATRWGAEGYGNLTNLIFADKYTLKVMYGNELLKREDNANEIVYYNNTGEDLNVSEFKVVVEYSGVEIAHIYMESSFTAGISAHRNGKILVYGTEYKPVDYEISTDIKNIGVDKTSRNILLDNIEYADRYMNWLADYYKNDVEYTLDYRGEPAIDCDDLIYMDNNFVARNLIRVTERTINTAQGMGKCTLKARRQSYRDYAKVDYAIVDVSEVK